MATKIQRCTKCSDKPHSQDAIHGEGQRVFNAVKVGESTKYRCTRCGVEV